jgi:GNAT superfamily N-acetyltransferase
MARCDSSHALGGFRLATATDAPAVERLMKESIRDLFPHFYDARQTASGVRYVGVLDPMLVSDGTFFLAESDGTPIACGGGSRRGKLYTGSGDNADDDRLLDPRTEPAHIRAMFVHGEWTRRGLGTAILQHAETAARAEGFSTLSLLATLPGFPLYLRYGFREVDRRDVTLPDGVKLGCVSMEKPITPPEGPRLETD